MMTAIPKRMIPTAVLTITGLLALAGFGRVRDCRQADKTVSFRLDVLPALQSKCIACHFDSDTPPGLSFSLPGAYANLVGRPSVEAPEEIIKPGDPAHSYLLRKVAMRKPAVGEQMPPYGAPLSPSQIKLLTEWIAQGAKDD